eukprot:1161979-Pelagomonas_calceolata.AAC.9
MARAHGAADAQSIALHVAQCLVQEQQQQHGGGEAGTFEEEPPKKKKKKSKQPSAAIQPDAIGTAAAAAAAAVGGAAEEGHAASPCAALLGLIFAGVIVCVFAGGVFAGVIARILPPFPWLLPDNVHVQIGTCISGSSANSGKHEMCRCPFSFLILCTIEV